MRLRIVLVSLPGSNNLAQFGCLDLGELGVQALVLGHVQSALDDPQREQCKEPLHQRLREDWVDLVVRGQFCNLSL